MSALVAAYRVAPREYRNRLRAIAELALEEAVGDLGQGEVIGNNRSRYIWTLTGRQTSGPWCAAACYAWLLRAAQSLGYVLPIDRTHNARELGRRVAAEGRWVEPFVQPAAGDLAVWARAGSPLTIDADGPGHIGIVRSARGVRFDSVEGNVGRFPAIVGEFGHELEEQRLLGFARLW